MCITILFLAILFFIGFSSGAQGERKRGPQPAPELEESFKLGMAGYTFVKFDLQTMLETMQRCDVHYLVLLTFLHW